jgi:fucose 4-O-acetylase-like acetyltransferase
LAIQALRGLAVTLMVAGHVIGIPGEGLRVPDDSLWRYCYLALADIRMPLFTLISGYVYAMAPLARFRDYPRLMKGKSRRLLLPLLTVGTVQYGLQVIVPNTHAKPHGGLWRVYLFGFDQLWFLQSLFIVFVVVGVLDGLGLLSTRRGWFAVTAVGAALWLFVTIPPGWDFFTISGAFRLFPFFVLGYGLRRHAMLDLHGAGLLVGFALFLCAFSIRLLTIVGEYHPDPYADRAIALSVGSTALILLYSGRNVLKTRAFAWIGGFSFGIYLLHVVAVAGTRIGLEHVGVHRRGYLFVIGMVVGVAAPIVVQRICSRWWVVGTFVFGESRPRRQQGRHSRPRGPVAAAAGPPQLQAPGAAQSGPALPVAMSTTARAVQPPWQGYAGRRDAV